MLEREAVSVSSLMLGILLSASASGILAFLFSDISKSKLVVELTCFFVSCPLIDFLYFSVELNFPLEKVNALRYV